MEQNKLDAFGRRVARQFCQYDLLLTVQSKFSD
jgi:hypothetical protein